MEIDISSTCRICLLEGDENVPMFDTNCKIKYYDLIKQYVGLDMIQDDNFPSVICNSCSSELLSAVEFISKCRISYEKLQQSLDLKINFNKITSSIVKEEDVPLSFLSAAIKEEINDDTGISDREVERNEILGVDSDFDYETAKRKEKLTKSKKSKSKKLVKKGPQRCVVCGLRVASMSALIIHNRIHTGEKPFKCPYCDSCFRQAGSLKDHVRRLHLGSKRPERPFICDTCGKQFLKNCDMKIHIRVHTREKPYQCRYCNSRFSQRGTLKTHLMLHTGERPFDCKVCGKVFIALTTLRRHAIVHTDERKYRCHICDKRLKSSSALKKHMIFLHTSEKPNICEVCGAAFAAVGNLASHMRNKHSERSGICDVCKKSFSNLEEHSRIHTGETPFQCHLCSRKFAIKRSLTSHINSMHKNAKKFACTVEECDKAFSMKCKLDFHILKFHSNHTPHICPHCSKGYYRLSDMTKHIKGTHGKKFDNSVLVI